MTTKLTDNMETILLRDKEQYPTGKILMNALADSYASFSELMTRIAGTEYGLTPEWNYYNDGKAWLCKVVYKKKTVFWLSIWQGYFKTAFYFTQRDCSGIHELDIAETIKADFISQKPVGKLLPLILNISTREQLDDLLKIIVYKKKLK